MQTTHLAVAKDGKRDGLIKAPILANKRSKQYQRQRQKIYIRQTITMLRLVHENTDMNSL